MAMDWILIPFPGDYAIGNPPRRVPQGLTLPSLENRAYESNIKMAETLWSTGSWILIVAVHDHPIRRFVALWCPWNQSFFAGHFGNPSVPLITRMTFRGLGRDGARCSMVPFREIIPCILLYYRAFHFCFIEFRAFWFHGPLFLQGRVSL